jgi:hypothetical protein
MRQLNIAFLIATAISILGWIALIGFPHWQHTSQFVFLICIFLLALIYVYLLFVARPEGIDKPKGSFWTLRGIIMLFQNPKAVLAGWVHFLAFDLLAALYLRADASQHQISHGWMIPVYLLTMMFGPAGVLLYLLIRVSIT